MRDLTGTFLSIFETKSFGFMSLKIPYRDLSSMSPGKGIKVIQKGAAQKENKNQGVYEEADNTVTFS